MALQQFLSKWKESFYENHNSFYVGFFANRNLGLTQLLQINTAIMYFQNGAKQDDDNKVRLHYLNIPISLKVKVGPLYGFAGINGGIKLGGDIYISGVKGNVKDISTWDAGIHAGLGFKIAIVGVEAKYNWGLIDIDKDYNSQYLQLGFLLYF